MEVFGKATALKMSKREEQNEERGKDWENIPLKWKRVEEIERDCKRVGWMDDRMSEIWRKRKEERKRRRKNKEDWETEMNKAHSTTSFHKIQQLNFWPHFCKNLCYVALNQFVPP